MIRDEHIDLGVAEGIITAEQATRLRALAARSPAANSAAADFHDSDVDPDDERFRLIGGFNDVFVAIGILLLVFALFGLRSAIGFGVGFAFVAMAAAWGLSEVFARRLRLALPAIALALMFAGAGGIAAYMLGSGLLPTPVEDDGSLAPIYLLSGIGVAIAAALHRWRFAVPIDTALIAAGLVCAVVGGLEVAGVMHGDTERALVSGVLGALIFAAAVRIDATDTSRLTRRSDVAFWLHLLAAPMLVQSVSTLLLGSAGEFVQAVGMLVLFAVFGVIAIVLDRRALLVSGLSYAGFAIGYLLSEGLAKDISLSLTLLGLAALILLLSAKWRALRNGALRVLPLGRFRQLVPPASA